jgi:hypothetical protein
MCYIKSIFNAGECTMVLRLGITIALAAVMVCTALSAEPTSDESAQPTSSPYLVLIRDPVIHELLKLNDKQHKDIERITDQVDGPLWRTRAMPTQQSAAAVAQLIANAKQAMNEILTPAQQQRLAQAELHALGMRSLFRQEVRQKLKLTDSQLKKIAKTLDSTKQEQAVLKKKHTSNKTRLQEKLDELFADEKKKIADLLDEQQHRRLRELVGEPFDTSRLGNIRFKAPQFDSTDGWLNTRGLRMEDLRGRVTVLHFWTYG